MRITVKERENECSGTACVALVRADPWVNRRLYILDIFTL